MQDVPPPVTDPQEARRLYIERSAGLYTTNNTLKVCTAGLVLATLLLTAGWLRAEYRLSNVKPFVVAVDAHGEPHVMKDGQLVYKPSEQVLKHFLLTFATKHYARLRATVQRDFADSLYFLDQNLANQILDQERRTKSIEKFLAEHGEEIDIHVSNVAVEETQNQVYRAVVDYERIYLRERREERRERYLGRFTFVMKDVVPVRLTPVNPLGLIILNMSENRAFTEGQ